MEQSFDQRTSRKVSFLILFATVLLGEIRFFPLNSGFRFGLGSTAFVLGVILYPELLTVRYSLLVGMSVAVFRIGLDFIGGIPISGMAGVHSPTIFYYLVLGFFLSQFKANAFRDRPIILGSILALFDFVANSVEILLWTELRQFKGVEIVFLEIAAIAIVKGFVVIGIVSVLMVYRLQILQEEERLRHEKLVGLAAGLYQESFFLKKAMNHIEEIMVKSFVLYQKLKDTPEKAVFALQVAEEVHEVKKDLHRVVGGLGRLVRVEENQEVLSLQNVFRIVVGMNQEYAKSFKLNLRMKSEGVEDTKITRVYPYISILNNLFSNAIEAMVTHSKDGGREGLDPTQWIIWYRADKRKDNLTIRVGNNGPDIPEDELSLIFEPGYTTKYTSNGIASTGIGLTHVKEVVESLQGRISLTSGEGKTEFVVEIPLENGDDPLISSRRED